MVLKLRQEKQREGISKQYCYINMTTNAHIKSCIATYYIKHCHITTSQDEDSFEWVIGCIYHWAQWSPSSSVLLEMRSTWHTNREKFSRHLNREIFVARKYNTTRQVYREEKEMGNEGKKLSMELTCLVNVWNAIRICFYIQQLDTLWYFVVLV